MPITFGPRSDLAKLQPEEKHPESPVPLPLARQLADVWFEAHIPFSEGFRCSFEEADDSIVTQDEEVEMETTKQISVSNDFEFNVKTGFILKYAEAYIVFGYRNNLFRRRPPTPICLDLQELSKSLGIEALFATTPGLVHAHVRHPQLGVSLCEVVRPIGGFNSALRDSITEIKDQVLRREVPIEGGTKLLEALIRDNPSYRYHIKCLLDAACTAALVLSKGGTVLEALACGTFTFCAVRWTVKWAACYVVLINIFEIVLCFSAGLCVGLILIWHFLLMAPDASVRDVNLLYSDFETLGGGGIAIMLPAVLLWMAFLDIRIDQEPIARSPGEYLSGRSHLYWCLQLWLYVLSPNIMFYMWGASDQALHRHCTSTFTLFLNPIIDIMDGLDIPVGWFGTLRTGRNTEQSCGEYFFYNPACWTAAFVFWHLGTSFAFGDARRIQIRKSTMLLMGKSLLIACVVLLVGAPIAEVTNNEILLYFVGSQIKLCEGLIQVLAGVLAGTALFLVLRGFLEAPLRAMSRKDRDEILRTTV